MQGRVVDQCVQLHGGAGYMDEYSVSRLFTAARVTPHLRRYIGNHAARHRGERCDDAWEQDAFWVEFLLGQGLCP